MDGRCRSSESAPPQPAGVAEDRGASGAATRRDRRRWPRPTAPGTTAPSRASRLGEGVRIGSRGRCWSAGAGTRARRFGCGAANAGQGRGPRREEGCLQSRTILAPVSSRPCEGTSTSAASAATPRGRAWPGTAVAALAAHRGADGAGAGRRRPGRRGRLVRRPGGAACLGQPFGSAEHQHQRRARRRHPRVQGGGGLGQQGSRQRREAAPTQVTFGRRDLVCSTRFADGLTGGIAGAELVVFEDCAHAPIYRT
jgi:hypothetical protein